jgi:hypothetical protein
LHKNSNSEFWKGISGGLKRRHLEITNAEISCNGEKIPAKKLKKELPRYADKGQHSTATGNDNGNGPPLKTFFLGFTC